MRLSMSRLSIGVHRVVGVDALYVLAIERGRHRAHVAQRLADRLDVLAALEHAGASGCDVGIVRERVPCTEHDVVERRDRHEVLDQRAAIVGALAEADVAHLGQAADGKRYASLHQFDTGDERGRHSAQPDGEHAEAAIGGSDGGRGRCSHGCEASGAGRPLRVASGVEGARLTPMRARLATPSILVVLIV